MCVGEHILLSWYIQHGLKNIHLLYGGLTFCLESVCVQATFDLWIFSCSESIFFFGTTILYVIWNLDIECNNIEMRQQIFD